MAAYANDYDGALPGAGGRATRWTGRRETGPPTIAPGPLLWTRTEVTERRPSVRACTYWSGTQLDPQSFVCPVDRGRGGLRPEEYGVNNKGLANLWDFGPDPARHCSYAYQMVYSPYKMAVAAEAWICGCRRP